MPSMNIELLHEVSSAEDSPAGLETLKVITQALQRRGWSASEPENWRDIGWLTQVNQESPELQIAVSEVKSQIFWAQIAASKPPTLLRRLFDKEAFVEIDATIARCADDLANGLDRISSVRATRWQWDGPPTPESPTGPNVPGRD